MANILTVFYSRKGENYMPGGVQILPEGHTAYAAEYIHQAVGGDLFRIETETPYAENYRQCCMQAAQEARENARPALKSTLADLSGYDTIFVCFPNWCGTAPMCVFTFLEQHDLAGKKIIPLCTNEGSGLANAPRDLANSCAGAEIAQGLSLLGHQTQDSREQITAWAKSQVQ